MWIFATIIATVLALQHTDASPYGNANQPANNNAQIQPLKATVTMNARDASGNIVDGPSGILELEQLPEGVRITGEIRGLQPGLHGFHVHDKGDLRKGCASAAGHFNPYKVNHGAPQDQSRHVGDLGNIEVGPDGVARIGGVDGLITLLGERGIVGRAFVVHEKPDDLGRGRTEESLKTGSAGGRLACGIVAFA